MFYYYMEKREYVFFMIGLVLILLGLGGFLIFSNGGTTSYAVGDVLNQEVIEEFDDLGNLEGFQIVDLVHKGKGLDMNYTFDDSSYVGEEIYLEIWIVNPEGVEVKRDVDIFSIKREGLVERSLLIKFQDNLVGKYEVYFALSSDLDNYLKKSFFVGNSLTTGNAVFNAVKGNVTGFVIFIIVIFVGVFLIFRSHRKGVQRMQDKGRILNTFNLKKLPQNSLKP